jgi:hypothetical protein
MDDGGMKRAKNPRRCWRADLADQSSTEVASPSYFYLPHQHLNINNKPD